MKIFKMLICVLLLASTSSQAASLTTKNNSSKAKCSPEEILKFKNEYIKLQNMLKYDAKTLDVKLNKNGKAIADQNKSNSDNNFAEQTEKALYAQYELALSKVGKIYQHLNKAEGLSESDNKFKIDHPEVTNFFQAIDPKSDDKNILNQNIDKILSQLQDQTIAGVTLSKEDNYLLSKLLVHSQDRVFTLNKYNSKKLTNKTRTPYLEQLNKEPLNKMINALREISADPETIVNVESKEAINSRVTDSINKMKELINNNGCRTYLRANPNFLGEPVQTCNYKYFIDSLSVPDAQFNQIASILHFINANQYIEKNHNYGRTNLGWIQKQFAGSTTTSCKFNSADNSISIQNPPFTTGANKKVDFNKFSCTTSDSKQLKSKRCFEYLDFKTDNSGFTVSPKNKLPKGIKIASFTVDGSDQIDNSCKKVLLTSAPPEQAPPIIPSPPTIPPASPSIPAVETSISTPSTTCKDREACEERKTNKGQIKWYEELHACYILTDEADKLFLCSASGIETKLAETADSCSKKEPPLKFDETKKLCIPAEVVETADTCSKKEPPLKFDETKKLCVPAEVVETADTCSKKEPPLKFDETKKICITKPKDEKCVFDPDGADLSPSQKKKCLAQLSAKPEEDDDAPDTKHEIPLKNTPLPARFVPTQVPTEQQGALRGMN